MSEDIFSCHYSGRGATGILVGVKAKDTAKHLTVHRTVPTTKDYLVPCVNGAKFEKPCSGENAKVAGHSHQPGNQPRGKPCAVHRTLQLLFLHHLSFVPNLEAAKSLSATSGERADPQWATKSFRV